ncbi:MAG: hypothetical protein SFZ03_07590 [Candidatus Melainabacteria bacterium]|nr:hypothetical protein [Candidatus Melainabacteria bacterium]
MMCADRSARPDSENPDASAPQPPPQTASVSRSQDRWSNTFRYAERLPECIILSEEQPSGPSVLQLALACLANPGVIWSFHDCSLAQPVFQALGWSEHAFGLTEISSELDLLSQWPKPTVFYVSLDHRFPSRLEALGTLLVPIVRLATTYQVPLVLDRRQLAPWGAPSLQELLRSHSGLQQLYQEQPIPYLECYPVLGVTSAPVPTHPACLTEQAVHSKAFALRGSLPWLRRLPELPQAWCVSLLTNRHQQTMLYSRQPKEVTLEQGDYASAMAWAFSPE